MNLERRHDQLKVPVSSKLQIPKPGYQPIGRSRCLEGLKREAHRPLLLLAAPTGYGKTALLAEWAHDLAVRSSVGWLTLDAGDNDPDRLMTHLILALPPSCDDVITNMPEQAPDARFDFLLQTLKKRDEVHLFFDQYEAIREEAIHRVFEDLIMQSGHHVHIYIASREKPPFLPNLRRLHPGPVVMTHEHLKLNAAEIQSWIRKHTGQQLQPDSVRQWEQSTEGWPLALYLSASLGNGSRAKPLGDQAAIDAIQLELQDIFSDELQRHPEELQRFHLRTSIPDGFDTELGCWLTDGATFHDEIGQLLHKNLFLFQGNDGQFRYHAMFSRFVRDRFRLLDPGGFLRMQEQTIAWHERHGRVIEAARHALRIPDYDRAAVLLLTDLSAIFSCPKSELIPLLEQFPRVEIGKRPAIAMIYSWFLTAEHRIATAETVLDQAEARLQGEPCLFPPTGEDLRGYFASIRSRIHFLRRDEEQGLAYMKETEARLNGPGYLYSHFNTIDPAGSSLLQSDAGHWGAVDQTMAMCEYAEPRWKGINQGYGIIQVMLGECWYERNRPDQAEGYLLNGRRIGLDLADMGLVLPATLALARLKSDYGEVGSAQLLLRETAQLTAAEAGEKARSVLDACQARLDMKAHQPAAVRKWLRSLPYGTDGALEMRHMYEYVTLLRAYLFLRQTGPGVQFGERLLQFSESWYLQCHIAEISLLLAVLYDSRGERSTAYRRLEKALDIGHREGYVRLFLAEWDVAESILLKYGKQLRLKNNPASREILKFYERLWQDNSEIELAADQLQYARKVLTPKEYKVLQGLLAGKSNGAIAEQLSIQVETAKTHCKHIYRKLNLKSRKDVQRHFADR